MPYLRFRCPRCGKFSYPYENLCEFCEKDLFEYRQKFEKPKWD